jgi:hypothetical protein
MKIKLEALSPLSDISVSKLTPYFAAMPERVSSFLTVYDMEVSDGVGGGVGEE